MLAGTEAVRQSLAGWSPGGRPQRSWPVLHLELTEPGSLVHPRTSLNLPWAGQGCCEFVSLIMMGWSYISMPQFLSVHGGITALPCCTGRCGNQLGNPSLNTSTSGPHQHPASTQFSTFFSECWGPSSVGREGEACGQAAGRLEVADKCPTQGSSGKPGLIASGTYLFAVKLSFGEIMLKGCL